MEVMIEKKESKQLDYIYFDQAASSFPKPKSVIDAVSEALLMYGANPGRGSHHLARKANEVVSQTRVKLASMFGIKQPKQVLFYQNATMALNQAIKGLHWGEGDHVITTAYEHNSVRRPLEYLKKEKGISISYITPEENGIISLDSIEKEITNKTKCIIVSHGSNLTGAIAPIKEIGEFAVGKSLTFIVDASQTAGIIPINLVENHIDLLAFPGHKGLLGPQGTGVLIAKEKLDLIPLVHGGTGGHSESPEQPLEWPERYESGTLNTPGLAGLLAGVEEVLKLGVDSIFEHEWELTKRCISGLNEIEGVTVFGPDMIEKRLGVIPFIIDGVDVHEAGMILDEHYKIALRAGFHCSPLAHGVINTSDYGGTLRASFGPYNTEKEVDYFIQAIAEIKAAF